MPAKFQERVLILAPVGGDASAMAAVLGNHGYTVEVCATPDGLARKVAMEGAGAVLLTEEALEVAEFTGFVNLLGSQPPWSELPLIILTRGGESRLKRLLDMTAKAAGSATLLERPIASSTLLRSIEVAIHSRRRQYQVRDLLAEQLRIQQRLRESDASFRLALRGGNIIVARCDAQLRYQWLYAPDPDFDTARLIGKRHTEVTDTDETRQLETLMQEAVQSGRRARAEIVFPLSDGPHLYDVRVEPLRDVSDRVVGAASVAVDITELKRVEKALAKAQEELQQHAWRLEDLVAQRTADLREINEQLESFVYSIAHDLRAPLRATLGCSQLLLEDYSPSLNGAGIDLLKRIQTATEFMDKLLLDLIAYGRMSRAGMELRPIEIRQVWQTAVFQCSAQIEEAGARVEAVEPLGTALADEPTLGQCVANLLSNAVKFVAPGTTPHVRCWTEEHDGRLRVSIQDNGIGIEPDQHERVFRVFERSHGTRYPGTGIGLSIVRKGAERMGGSVGLESAPGKGSRFWIDLAKAGC